MEELPYCVPKRVPKWVAGFPAWLREASVLDPAVQDMADTWQKYEGSHWLMFQGLSKKRKPRERPEGKGDGPAEGEPETKKPRVRRRILKHVDTIQEILQREGNGNQELTHHLQKLKQIVNQDL